MNPPSTGPDAAHASSWQARALWVGRSGAVALLFVLPVSTAAAAVSATLMVLGWFLAGGLFPTLASLRREPAFALACALLAWLAVSMAWTPAPAADALAALGKYRKLLLLPIAGWLFASAPWRRYALLAFAASMLVTLAGSYASAAGLFVSPVQLRWGLPDNHLVFKPHITQGWLMSLFAFGLLVMAGRAGSRNQRAAFALLGVLAVLNVLFLTKGRTGYIVVVALLAAWLLLVFGTRRALVPIVVLPVLLGGLLSVDNPFRQRVFETVEDLRQMDRRPERVGSTELRYMFVRNAFELIADAPVLGHGLGSTATVHGPLAGHRTGSAAQVMSNPHNQYLDLAIQGGVVAAALWIAVLVALARRAAQLHGTARRLAVGFMVLIAVGCLVNSSLLDFTEGHVFAVAAGLLVAAARACRPHPGI